MQTHQSRTGWSSWAMFAGLMMILVGIFQQIQGLVAIFNDDWYLVTNKGLALSVDYTVWGWVHFVLGLIIATAGVAVFNGKTWARHSSVACSRSSVRSSTSSSSRRTPRGRSSSSPSTSS